jgi:hypothetical protein
MQGYLASVDCSVDKAPEMIKKGLAQKPANP